MKNIENIDHLIILDKEKLIDQGKPEELRYDNNWYKKDVGPIDLNYFL